MATPLTHSSPDLHEVLYLQEKTGSYFFSSRFTIVQKVLESFLHFTKTEIFCSKFL